MIPVVEPSKVVECYDFWAMEWLRTNEVEPNKLRRGLGPQSSSSQCTGSREGAPEGIRGVKPTGKYIYEGV